MKKSLLALLMAVVCTAPAFAVKYVTLKAGDKCADGAYISNGVGAPENNCAYGKSCCMVGGIDNNGTPHGGLATDVQLTAADKAKKILPAVLSCGKPPVSCKKGYACVKGKCVKPKR